MKRLALAGLLALASSLAADEHVDVPIRSWTAPPHYQQAATENGPLAARAGEPSPQAAAAVTRLTFVAVSPCRVLDTRGYVPPTPAYGFPALAPGERREFQVGGSCGIPVDASAVSANATVTATTGPGYLALWEGGNPTWPGNSTVNFGGPGITLANAAVVPLGAAGKISAWNATQAGTLHFILDVNGYYAPGGSVTSLNALTGDVTLAPGANVTLTPAGNAITIAAASATGVSSVATGTGLAGGPITSTGTISLANTAVVPGQYTNPTITVNAQGQLTAASNGGSPGAGPWTVAGNDIANSNTGYVGIAANLVLADSSRGAGAAVQMWDKAGTARVPVLHAYSGTDGVAGGNLFLGGGAGNFALAGIFNVGVGAASLAALTSGSDNVALGHSSLALNTTGINNIAVGSGSLGRVTGSDNIAIGLYAGYGLLTGDYNIDIGSQGVAGDSGTIRIGAAANHTRAFLAGVFPAAPSVGALPNRTVIVSDTGQLGALDVLDVPRGGTGASALAANNVLLGNGTGALQAVAPGAAGHVLRSNGTTWVSDPAGAVTSVSGVAPVSVATGTTTPVVSVAGATTTSVGVVQLAGDLNGTATAPGVATVGGSTAANVHAAELAANAATASNTASTIVRRDSSGAFAAGGIATGNQNGLQVGPYGAAAGNTGEIRFLELAAIGTNYVALRAPDTIGAATTYTLPGAYPDVTGKVLASDLSGNLSWATPVRFVTAPISSTSSCTVGDFAADPTYLYVCRDTNRWIRIVVAAW